VEFSLRQREIVDCFSFVFFSLPAGKTGDWKNHFDPQLNERIDRWIESNLTGSDLKFVTELENQD